MKTDNVLDTFLLESRELLEDMEAQLLAVMSSGEQSESINAIFRAAHTIKGSAGLFGLDAIVGFTHAVESVLDAVRDGRLAVGDVLVSVLLRSTDHIGALLARVESGRLGTDQALSAAGDALLAALGEHLPSLAKPRKAAAPGVASDTWHLSLRFAPEAMQHGYDPLALLHHLESLGTIRGLFTVFDRETLGEEMDPERCALGFELALSSDAREDQIESAFELAGEDCRLWVVPPHAPVSAYLRLADLLPEGVERLQAAWIATGSVTADELATALAAAEPSEPALVFFDDEDVVAPEAPAPAPEAPAQAARAPAGAAVVALAPAQAAPEAPAPAPADKPAAPRATESRSIRIDADRLDQLIDLVGELIIASASADLISRAAGVPGLREATSNVSGLVEALRDSALQLRMVKIAATFNRFTRVVHDVARELGKDIALQIAGEDTELDKTVIEKIGDPLMHLVRNAMDHGIEPVEQRVARGKPAQGTVKLNAFHDSGSIVIEVSDDGGGLKRDRILAKAVERGLVEPGRVLTDGEIYALIFEPGFSTAEKVTNLSGRGVGMDVVKRNITAFRGTVAIDSKEGVGTTVTVRLPLTLAIINGFLFSVCGTSFVVPLDAVEECVAYDCPAGAGYTSLRGEVLPLVHTRPLFALEGPRALRENIIVIRHGRQRAGLVVDALLGEFQTVIKPLGKVFAQARCLSGSTILGNGEVALIMDVPAVFQQSMRSATAAAHVSALAG